MFCDIRVFVNIQTELASYSISEPFSNRRLSFYGHKILGKIPENASHEAQVSLDIKERRDE